MDRRALDTGNTQGHPPVVDLVVGVVLQQGVGDLGQTQPLLGLHDEADDADPVDHHRAHLVRAS